MWCGVGVPCGDLHVAQVHPGVEHRCDEGVSQHVRVQPRHPHPRRRGQRTSGPLVLRPVSGKPITRSDAYRMVIRIGKAFLKARTATLPE